MEQFPGTTIVSARRGSRVALGGDGQVTLGNIVIKASARKVRRLHHDRVLGWFAGCLLYTSQAADEKRCISSGPGRAVIYTFGMYYVLADYGPESH